MSRRYAIRSLEEARTFLAHPVLGARYRECVAVLQDLVGTTAEAVFGPVDAAKLRSSLTLFAEAAPGDPLLAAALQRWFRGEKDGRTVRIVRVDGSRARRGGGAHAGRSRPGEGPVPPVRVVDSAVHAGRRAGP